MQRSMCTVVLASVLIFISTYSMYVAAMQRDLSMVVKVSVPFFSAVERCSAVSL